MMFERLLDPLNVESEQTEVAGLGRLKGDVHFETQKIVQKGCYNLFGVMVNGYEIHNGVSKKRAKKKKNFYGTFVHGLFDNDALRYKIFHSLNEAYRGYNFKEFKADAIEEFAQHIETSVNVDTIEKALYE
jgi:adenosylcobyric acid synthase